MIRLLPLALLASCAWPRAVLFRPSPYTSALETKCGLSVVALASSPLPGAWTLDAAQDVETRALRALGSLSDSRFWSGCTRLRGWQVVVIDAAAWESPEHRTATNPLGVISGYTHCPSESIFVGNAAPVAGVLAHELAHAIQGCEPVDDGRNYLDSHYLWEPIYAALRAEGLRP